MQDTGMWIYLTRKTNALPHRSSRASSESWTRYRPTGNRKRQRTSRKQWWIAHTGCCPSNSHNATTQIRAFSPDRLPSWQFGNTNSVCFSISSTDWGNPGRKAPPLSEGKKSQKSPSALDYSSCNLLTGTRSKSASTTSKRSAYRKSTQHTFHSSLHSGSQ